MAWQDLSSFEVDMVASIAHLCAMYELPYSLSFDAEQRVRVCAGPFDLHEQLIDAPRRGDGECVAISRDLYMYAEEEGEPRHVLTVITALKRAECIAALKDYLAEWLEADYKEVREFRKRSAL